MSSKLTMILLLLASMLFADVGVQTDWSSGPGQPGPVTEWTDSFASAYLINWGGTPGSVMLDQNAESHEVGSISDLRWAKPCDITNSGLPDVFVNTSNGCYWYRNISGGSHFVRYSFPIELDDIGAGDINNDGLNDVAGSYRVMHGGFIWLERLSSGGWAEHDISAELQPYDIQVLDFDGDGDIDVVGTYIGGSIPDQYHSISWWENLGNGLSWEKQTIYEEPATSWFTTSLDVSDYDNDGDYDAVCGSGDAIYLFVNQGTDDGWELQVIEYETAGSLTYVTFADINGAGNQDLAVGSRWETGDVLWFEEVTPLNWTEHLISS